MWDVWERRHERALPISALMTNMKSDFPSSYMYLAIVLTKLSDSVNACAAYEKAIEMENDHVCELNYSICLYNMGNTVASKQHYLAFLKLWETLNEDSKNSDDDVKVQMNLLRDLHAL